MSANNKRSLSTDMFLAIGVVYGDIGTSPLYTLRECLSGKFGFGIEKDFLFGLLSLIFWLLILVVSVKYLIFVMRADNDGEGGILVLMSLATHKTSTRITSILVTIGLIGSSFFYGEAVITPAISVMSAIEGLEIITPKLSDCVVPLSVMVLTFLFLIQQYGTKIIGKFFAPITLIWLLILAVLGLRRLIEDSYVLHALNPFWAVNFFLEYKSVSFAALGAAVLSITGVEALYADMGHFGKLPIRLTWFIIVLPSLTLNYFGQGAFLLKHPEAIKNPFFLMAPEWAFIPMLIISTLVTVIASQAVISGVFSLTRQAVHLGYLFPIKIIHLSKREPSQIYIPFVNWLLYFSVMIVIFSFEHSSNLAEAYGIAVTGTMALTSILSTKLAYQNWKWNKFLVGIILTGFLSIDMPLFSANLDKIISGGWLPLTLGIIIFIIMTTWKNECLRFLEYINNYGKSLKEVILSLENIYSVRVSGTAVYISHTLNKKNFIPFVFLHNLKHNKVLHKQVILMTFYAKNSPRVHNAFRIQIEQLSSTFWYVLVSYGWYESLNMQDISHYCISKGLNFSMIETSFFIHYKSLTIGKRPWYLRLREKLYFILQRNALHETNQFKIPYDRVIWLGTNIKI